MPSTDAHPESVLQLRFFVEQAILKVVHSLCSMVLVRLDFSPSAPEGKGERRHDERGDPQPDYSSVRLGATVAQWTTGPAAGASVGPRRVGPQ